MAKEEQLSLKELGRSKKDRSRLLLMVGVGVGAILLALNVARRLSGIPADHFSLVLGSIAAVGGATVFVLHQWFGMPPAELPLLPTIFLGIGVVIVAYAVASWRRTRQSGGTPD